MNKFYRTGVLTSIVQKKREFSTQAYGAFADLLRSKAEKHDSITALQSDRSLTPSEKKFNAFLKNSIHTDCSEAEIQAIAATCVDIVMENSGLPVSPARDIAHSPEKFDYGKQKDFADTLRDFNDAMQSIGQRYFLAAGTALAAIRDGKFIQHDEDIDIGIFYDISEGADSVQRFVSALNAAFTPFQALGAPDNGLELRFMHQRTKVQLDVNWFYPAQDAENKPFLWCATYFGAAEQRKHKMYRYRHGVFSPQLCEFANGKYWVPPEKYFEEYYGADWRVPKKFDYWEGLAGEYKNIIPE